MEAACWQLFQVIFSTGLGATRRNRRQMVLTFTKFRPKDLDLGDFLTPSMTKADQRFFWLPTFQTVALRLKPPKPVDMC